MERTYSVCCGVDVGKSSHHFAAIIPATGELVFDGKVEQSESGIRDALLSVSLFGSPVVVVDQPGKSVRPWRRTSRERGSRAISA